MIVTSYKDLSTAFDHVILSRAESARLHDIWRMGAPTPDSIILDLNSYDERNISTVKRIIPESWLQPFVKEIAATRGIPLTKQELISITGA